jgi:hypothetical protein
MAALMMNIETESIARGVVEGVSDHKIVLGIPATNYQLHLTLTVPVAQITVPIGKRIRGIIEAQALRVFRAAGGGQFIEPIIGEPRIIAGLVFACDPSRRRLLIHVPVPIWITLEPDQTTDAFKEGDLVNCYVDSGAKFTPYNP